MKKQTIKTLLCAEEPIKDLIINGWVKTRRNSKDFSFIELNDGSCLKSIQIIINNTIDNYDELSKVTIGSSLRVEGSLTESPGKGQKWEIVAEKTEILGNSPDDYPLQKKRHTDEFLRTIAHLRPRTNKYAAAFRIRSEASFLIHSFFRKNNFFNINTPLITGSDCEGAGEIFRVTTLEKINDTGDDEKDFFGKQSNLTVSGQLSAEMLALSLGKVYTFGPTFRAENSNTSRHIAEFWMLEPEMAFADLWDNMQLSEDLLVYITENIINNCREDIELFQNFVNKKLFETLETLKGGKFEKITYEDAVQLLKKANKEFNFKPEYGNDLQTEHERFLAEDYFKKPVFVYNYPKTIKPFYMRLNDDNKTVAAMDLLVPGIGELIGGSQREERLDYLKKRMIESEIDPSEYWWYLDSRKYGSVPHSGFGLGFERLLMLLTGISNIRDVIPFPRTPGSIEF